MKIRRNEQGKLWKEGFIKGVPVLIKMPKPKKLKLFEKEKNA